MNDYGAQIQSLSQQLEKLHMKIDALAKACKVSIDYNPHSYDVNPLPEEEEESNG